MGRRKEWWPARRSPMVIEGSVAGQKDSDEQRREVEIANKEG